MGALGVMDRLAGELPVGLPVAELADEKKTFGRMVDAGKALRGQGADVIVMGCAGMARYRKPLQDAVGIPVVEPTQAAVSMAIGRVRLGWEAAWAKASLRRAISASRFSAFCRSARARSAGCG